MIKFFKTPLTAALLLVSFNAHSSGVQIDYDLGTLTTPSTFSKSFDTVNNGYLFDNSYYMFGKHIIFNIASDTDLTISAPDTFAGLGSDVDIKDISLYPVTDSYPKYVTGYLGGLGNNAGGLTNTITFSNLTHGSYYLYIDGKTYFNSKFETTFTLANHESISPVPLPAALPLMLSGLGVLGFASRRRKETV